MRWRVGAIYFCNVAFLNYVFWAFCFSLTCYRREDFLLSCESEWFVLALCHSAPQKASNTYKNAKSIGFAGYHESTLSLCKNWKQLLYSAQQCLMAVFKKIQPIKQTKTPKHTKTKLQKANLLTLYPFLCQPGSNRSHAVRGCNCLSGGLEQLREYLSCKTFVE